MDDNIQPSAATSQSSGPIIGIIIIIILLVAGGIFVFVNRPVTTPPANIEINLGTTTIDTATTTPESVGTSTATSTDKATTSKKK